MGKMFDNIKVFVNELAPGQPLESVFQVKEASLKTTRKGSTYVDAVVGDRTGQVNCKLWDAPGNALETFRPGAYLRIIGRTDEYQGRTQVVLDGMPREEKDVNAADFVETSPIDFEHLKAEFKRLSALVEDTDYSALIKAVFSDKDVWGRFSTWPAAAQYHHAYRHGLFEHTVSVAVLALDVAEKTMRVNRDLILAGALVHDIGKIYELTGEPPYDYTDDGRLMGHLHLGARLIETKAAGIKGFPEAKLLLMVHLILAHHGQREFGSPVLPAIPEAIALHLVDNVDAKVRAATAAIEGDVNPNTNWTDFQKMLDARIYKAGPPPGGSGE